MTDLTASDAPDARFLALLQDSLAQARFVKLTLAKPQGAEPGLARVMARRITLRGEDCLSLVSRYATRDITKNLPLPQAVAEIRTALGSTFRNAHLHTLTEEVQLAYSKKGKPMLSVAKIAADDAAQAAPPTTAHNREKQRWLDLNSPFLTALGVTTPQHQLVPAMARKWKQINKFIEVFAHALASSSLAEAKDIHVVDFGSGKGYLTFAIHDWLRQAKGVAADVTGVELRPDMVALCNQAIAQLGLQGLRIEQGDVRTWKPQRPESTPGRPKSTQPPRGAASATPTPGGAIDVMIALHACDTATDYAIHLGLRAGAQIIMCSPCCHSQLRQQLLSPGPLQPILQHGVHLDQEAEMVTDGLRALLLEACGYDTKVFEFISLEHTNKNKMILAVKRAQPKDPAPVLAQIAEIKQFYGIREQCLERLVRDDILA